MLVRSLDELTAADTADAGGKGANLGELRRAEFPVPDGFVITTASYALAAEAAGVTGETPATARVRLAASPVPAGIAHAVREAYRALGASEVAVRSSATAEDLPDASFAGQQDTMLGVSGEDAVLDAVRRCWASLWNDRAVAYRQSHDVPAEGLRLAVVVQRMVDAESAGVLFTADPITGRRRRATIEAVRGLGEQLVSGAVNPDHFVVNTRSDAVLERRGDILTDAQLRELAALGARIEDHFGRPQDIEWAIDRAGKLWIVQSRDITTLYPLPPTAPDDENDLRVYFSANVAQGVFDPFTPMGLQTFRLLSSAFATAFGRPVKHPAAGASIYAESGMRVFMIGVALPLADPRRGSPHRCAAERGAHDAATGRHAKESAGRARSSYCECPHPGNVGPAARRLRAAHPHVPTAVFSPLGRHRDPRRSELRARGPRARRARATGRAADRPSRSSAQPHDGDGPRALGDRARGARGPGVARCSAHAASRRALGPVPRCHAPPAPSARDDELPPALRAPGDRRDRSRRQALVRRPGASARSDCELSPAG
ncbi:MAG: hypothetical protein E6I14_05850 [Chloroflexi bacterium]|nr:MAG: hypothetical protein E6I14_05850 [Chloroflexota bacterium]